RRASGSRASPELVLSEPPRSQRPSRIRRFLDRVVTSRPGSGSCRAKTRLAANRSLGRSRNGAIAICDEFWWSEPAQCCDTRAISRRSILGSQSILERKPFKVVAAALANKMARIAWALLAKGDTYRVPALAAAT